MAKHSTTQTPFQLLEELLGTSTQLHILDGPVDLVACSCGCLEIVPYNQAVWEDDDLDAPKYGQLAFKNDAHLGRYYPRQELEETYSYYGN